jgi:hypothetical protein
MPDLASVGLSNWIALVATIIASASLIVALKNSRVAQQGLKISWRTSNLGDPNFAVYLIDTFRYRVKSQKKALYVFCISINNKSTIQNSITNVEMRLPLIRAGLETVSVFVHNPRPTLPKGFSLKNVLKLPALLPARGALIGNCCFEVPEELLEGADFGSHFLRIKYAEGPNTELEPKIIMDIIDDQHLEQKRKTGVPL